MTPSSLSSLREALRDPVLRRWRLGRLRGLWPTPPQDAARPAYLDGLPPLEAAAPRQNPFASLPQAAASGALRLVLAGLPVDLATPAAAFDHRLPRRARAAFDSFAWLSLQPDIAPGWVAALWAGWLDHHGTSADGSAAWAADVAAARVVHLLSYARRVGLPGAPQRTLDALAAHGPAIAGGLDGSTSATLALHGHGLYRLGLDLGLEAAARRGVAMLTGEAERLIRPSGIIAEDSTGRHLRLCQAYADAWLAARRHQRGEAGRLEAIAHRLFAVLPALTLPGGLPEIGAVPTDMPPALLADLLPGGAADQGWTGLLPVAERQALLALRDRARLNDLEALRADGWLRFDAGPWSSLWHAAADGWTPRAAGGHQDLGSFELHHGGLPVFIDPGEPPAGRPADMLAFSRSAAAHGSLTLDDEDPYPADRSCYGDAFRRAVGGPPPVLRTESDGASLHFEGYHRLGGPREASRRWRFADGTLTIDDMVNGTGRYRVARRLVTPLTTVVERDAAVLSADGLRLRVIAEFAPTLTPARRWRSDGSEQALTVITFARPANLPWRGRLTIEAL